MQVQRLVKELGEDDRIIRKVAAQVVVGTEGRWSFRVGHLEVHVVRNGCQALGSAVPV